MATVLCPQTQTAGAQRLTIPLCIPPERKDEAKLLARSWKLELRYQPLTRDWTLGPGQEPLPSPLPEQFAPFLYRCYPNPPKTLVLNATAQQCQTLKASLPPQTAVLWWDCSIRKTVYRGEVPPPCDFAAIDPLFSFIASAPPHRHTPRTRIVPSDTQLPPPPTLCFVAKPPANPPENVRPASELLRLFTTDNRVNSFAKERMPALLLDLLPPPDHRFRISRLLHTLVSQFDTTLIIPPNTSPLHTYHCLPLIQRHTDKPLPDFLRVLRAFGVRAHMRNMRIHYEPSPADAAYLQRLYALSAPD